MSKVHSITVSELENKIWWNYMEPDIRELLREAVILLTNVKKWKHRFHDYAFIVFPAAKAYEGFLKHLFLDMGFITEEDYRGKHFRIGRALNPALEPRFRDNESVYDRLVLYCRGRELPDTLWEAWRKGRNLTFHWFPDSINALTYSEARGCVDLIIKAIDLSFTACEIDLNKKKEPSPDISAPVVSPVPQS
jgi:hypothetical protein